MHGGVGSLQSILTLRVRATFLGLVLYRDDIMPLSVGFHHASGCLSMKPALPLVPELDPYEAQAITFHALGPLAGVLVSLLL